MPFSLYSELLNHSFIYLGGPRLTPHGHEHDLGKFALFVSLRMGYAASIEVPGKASTQRSGYQSPYDHIILEFHSSQGIRWLDSCSIFGNNRSFEEPV